MKFFQTILWNKILENLCKVRKKLNHKRNINWIYKEKLPYNFLQQFLTLKLQT